MSQLRLAIGVPIYMRKTNASNDQQFAKKALNHEVITYHFVSKKWLCL